VIRTVIVGCASGLHARAAAIVARAAAARSVPITIRAAGRRPVPADSVLALLTLGAAGGAELILEAHGDDAASAIDWLAALLESDLDATAVGGLPCAPAYDGLTDWRVVGG
jgi:phosphocarrier protein HPr